MIASEEDQFIKIEFGDLQHFVEIQDDRFYQRFADTFDNQFEEGTALDLDVPPWDELLSQLEETVGSRTRTQYVHLIETTVTNDIDSVEEVAVAIIATALSGDLLYDISKWGEDTHIASKASFSRRKTKLENDGVITTQKVPVEIGRPRLRLRLGERIGNLSMDIGVDSKGINGSNPTESDKQASRRDTQLNSSGESDGADANT